MGCNGKSDRLKKERDGLCFINKYGESYVILDYKSALKIKIKFHNNYEKYVSWCEIKKNTVKSPYCKNVFEIGYLGSGKYDSITHKQAHMYWSHIIRRCYDPYTINKHLAYIDCFVCEEWLNFQNFAKWFYENYYEIEGQRMELDKDILCKGNKIYSPETCIFVPKRINQLFVGQRRKRGKYPIGVAEDRDRNRNKILLVANCSILNKNQKVKHKNLGRFPLNKPFQAFYTYKQFKENYIKEIADEYKDFIPKKLYDALYKWEVEIND